MHISSQNAWLPSSELQEQHCVPVAGFPPACITSASEAGAPLLFPTPLPADGDGRPFVLSANDAANEEEVDMMPGRGIWLLKKAHGFGALTGKKQRFTQLVFGVKSHQLKLNCYAGEKEGKGHDKRDCFVFSSIEATSITTSGNRIAIKQDKRTWYFFAASEEQARTRAGQWRAVIKDLLAGDRHTIEEQQKSNTLAASSCYAPTIPVATLPFAVRLLQLLNTESNIGLDSVRDIILREYGQAAVEQHDAAIAKAVQSANKRLHGPLPSASATGWLLKLQDRGEDQRLFFELRQSEVHFYKEADNDVGQLPQGHFCMSTASQVGRSGLQLTIVNPDRDWVLVAETDAQAKAWQQARIT